MKLDFSKDQLNRLYRFAVTLCNDPDQGYDLVHSAIEKMLLTENVDKPMSYARTIIRNSYIDAYRQQMKYTHTEFDSVEALDVIDITAPSFEDMQVSQQLFQQCWNTMEPQERELLFLYSVEEYTAQEIADESGTSRGVILSRVHRLKQKLRKLINHDDMAREG